MIVKKIVVGELEANCYILADEKTKRAIIIDPGGEAKKILWIVKQNKLKVIYIINTHAHIDHIGANDIIRGETGAFLLVHSSDAHLLEDPQMNLSTMMNEKRKFLPPTRVVKEGDEIKVDQICMQVLHTPGHTPGSICLYIRSERVFTGDTLFAGSVGRVDLPGGSPADLQNSIREKLLTLPEKVIVHPGHGPDTTIGKEKKDNPFINPDWVIQ
ncbi:MBL fold metallo-hydrolase [Candidatus Aerophobetes bacterium]|nr:MBL fold metallo-hydrolase [Candidatus Aerophobetes bacterium]